MVQKFRTFHLNREKIKSGGSPKFSIFFVFLFCFVLFCFCFCFLAGNLVIHLTSN